MATRWLVGALVVSILAAVPAMAQSEPARPPKVAPAEFGTPFPVATYANLNAGVAGPEQIDLGQFLGKQPLVLFYWIPGHRRSEEMLLKLQEINGELGDKVAVLSVATERPGREAPKMTERIRQIGVRVPVLNDVGFRIGQQLLVQTVPSISVLDAEGTLRLTNGGSLSQTVEYNLDIAGVIRRAAKTGNVGTYGPMPRYYPVTELVGQKCPDFQAPMLPDGVVRRWSSLLDPRSVNVLLFWSVDCPHCKKALPQINAWLKQNSDGINVVSAAKISNDSMRTRTRDFCKYNGFVFPTLLDENQEVGDLFQVTATPTILIIGPDGVIDSALVTGTPDLAKTLEQKKKTLLN